MHTVDPGSRAALSNRAIPPHPGPRTGRWRRPFQIRPPVAGGVPGVVFLALLVLLILLGFGGPAAADVEGYYRYPALHADTLVFAAEGDLWLWTLGSPSPARRLTTHLEEESHPALSPDGRTLTFTGAYDGAAEVYSMPVAGGIPTRRTFEGERARVQGWSPDGRILYSTRRYSTLPNTQLALIDLEDNQSTLLPLAQAAQGCFDAGGETLFFTRQAFHGSHTKYYRGGTAQNLWRYRLGESEAIALTASYPGTSRDPMFWSGRIYFVSDRDGTMNIWSLQPDGSDIRQHTHHAGWDIKSPSLSEGRIVYQLGADLYLHDLAAGTTERLPIVLSSDFDQMRERWVEEPFDYLSHAAISPSGDRLVLTLYGQVFVAPTKGGRLVDVTRRKDIRCRQAIFSADGRHILALADASGEVEWWRYPADGWGDPEQLSDDGRILRLRGTPSPDGRYLAYTDHDQALWILDLEKGKSTLVDSSPYKGLDGPRWSPDSRWLAYAMDAASSFGQIYLYSLASKESLPVTSDRYDSWNATFSRDGRWLYFLSDRHFVSTVHGPWGSRQPDPYFDEQTEIYLLPLQAGLRSPFEKPDELSPAAQAVKQDSSAAVTLDADGIERRLHKVPLPPGNYRDLALSADRLFWIRHPGQPGRGDGALVTMKIGDPDTVKSVLSPAAASYALSGDCSRIMIREGSSFFVTDASSGKAPDRATERVDLEKLAFTIRPHELWRQMFLESWRLQRDYFWDPNMRGLDWDAILAKYLPLVGRVTCRGELSDLQAAMASELGTLHTWVYGGDHRNASEPPSLASLGARLTRDPEAGGYRIDHIYESDPDLPDQRSPLRQPGVDVNAGDIIVSINGQATLAAPHLGALLRNQAGSDLRMRVRPAGRSTHRDLIVKPMPVRAEWNLRYGEWEYTRRMRVEEMSAGQIGYVHLRSMGRDDMGAWQREFYPVFNRRGLILDVRHNTGGNIDSWILGKLLRRAWMYWQPRSGEPYSNMQYAFRGHMVILVDEYTQSDGEALAEGFRRLGLGSVIGTRTWGGEVWLTSSNRLVDHGIVTAAEFGVYGPEGEWLIENHGVDPDIVIDNLPAATFAGRDAQLERAIAHLQSLIEQDPRPLPEPPAYPPVGE